jgi:glycine cleavage system protein P-like pyridoxal-binding family
MPPIITVPAANGATHTTAYNFVPANAHGTHPAISNISQWKVTVTTASSGGGTLKTQTTWKTVPISTCLVTGLPADNGFYYCQVIYRKSDGSTWVGTSNYFRSQPS